MSKREHVSHIVDKFETLAIGDDGTYSYTVIQAAAMLDAARSARRIRTALEGIERSIASLGADGIHTAIRHAAKKARRAAKREQAKRKAAKDSAARTRRR